MSKTPLVTERFEGPTRIKATLVGIRTSIVFKIKPEGWLDLRDGTIVGYKGVSPQPYVLRNVVQIREVERANPAAKKSTTKEVDEAALKARERIETANA